METRPRNSIRQLRLLIVDPIAHSRHSISSYLQLQRSLEVLTETASAAEAMELTRQHRPDVVIMDANPPDMDGFAATRRLLSLNHPPVVILLSTHCSARDKQRAQRAGASAYLARSAGVDEILDTLHSLSDVIAEELLTSR